VFKITLFAVQEEGRHCWTWLWEMSCPSGSDISGRAWKKSRKIPEQG